jgi:hypothetical protein
MANTPAANTNTEVAAANTNRLTGVSLAMWGLFYPRRPIGTGQSWKIYGLDTTRSQNKK